MVGTAQFGIALNQFVMLTNAVTTGAQLFSESPGMTTPYTNTVNAMIQAASPSLTLTAAAITTQVCTAVSASTCTTWSSCSTDATCATLLNTYAGNPAQVKHSQEIAHTPIPTAPYYFNDPTKFFSTDGRSGTCPSASNPKYSSVGNILGEASGGPDERPADSRRLCERVTASWPLTIATGERG
jgi:hypothetical protein